MKSTTPGPKGVRLTREEIAQVKKIADELGLTEHAIMHYAVRHFLAQWAKGWRPKISKKVVKELEP